MFRGMITAVISNLRLRPKCFWCDLISQRDAGYSKDFISSVGQADWFIKILNAKLSVISIC